MQSAELLWMAYHPFNTPACTHGRPFKHVQQVHKQGVGNKRPSPCLTCLEFLTKNTSGRASERARRITQTHPRTSHTFNASTCHGHNSDPNLRFASGQASEEEIKERQARSMADPEVQNILKDPVMQQVLKDFQVRGPPWGAHGRCVYERRQ